LCGSRGWPARFSLGRCTIRQRIALHHLSPRVTLLIFALIVGLGIVAAAPVLVRSPLANSHP